MTDSRRTCEVSRQPLILIKARAELSDDRLYHAILERARANGWLLRNLSFTQNIIPFGSRPDGAIIEVLPSDTIARRLLKIGCPVVRVGNWPHPHDDRAPAVLPDVVAGARMAAEHFCERGFRNVGYVGRKPWGKSRGLFDAFADRARELGCHVHPLRLESDWRVPAEKRYGNREEQIRAWLTRTPKPIGVLNFSDVAAATLSTVCERIGLNVPAEVAILGSGNKELSCEMAPVPLSSIDWALDHQGEQAMDLLGHLMRGDGEPVERVFVKPAGIVTRQSTDMLAVDDMRVASALRFVWDHLAQDLSVDDIANAVGISRRPLERAFRRHLGRGINEERLRKRLERCCELLRATDERIVDLAPTLGFHSADVLHRSFRRTFNMTPRQYRLSQR